MTDRSGKAEPSNELLSLEDAVIFRQLENYVGKRKESLEPKFLILWSKSYINYSIA